MPNQSLNTALLAFLQASPTPFHAVAVARRLLDEAGFTPLPEAEGWNIHRNGRYYVIRNDSAIVAFKTGSADPLGVGIRMAGAHTDSPCLKVKPDPDINAHGYQQLGVEIYGGALLNPWFDRDLSLAGRVTYRDQQGHLDSTLIDFKRAIAVAPSLAIHLDRDVNKGRETNPQTQLPPILSRTPAGDSMTLRDLLLQRLAEEGVPDAQELLDFELCFYDTQPAALIGFREEFIAGARLDNLLSCYVGLRALIDSVDTVPTLMICNDHEEVGSCSTSGADGPMLGTLLERWFPETETRSRIIDRSLMMSVDNAHGLHPNFADKHDGNHGPLLNAGPVIKVNANQRYATNSETAALFRHLCRQEEVPVQTFATRADMGCGSTIGPLTAAQVGVATLDVGVPTFAMHSCRELAGSEDPHYLYRVLKRYFERAESPRI
jgi:aspartyl aminopeptidase